MFFPAGKKAAMVGEPCAWKVPSFLKPWAFYTSRLAWKLAPDWQRFNFPISDSRSVVLLQNSYIHSKEKVIQSSFYRCSLQKNPSVKWFDQHHTVGSMLTGTYSQYFFHHMGDIFGMILPFSRCCSAVAKVSRKKWCIVLLWCFCCNGEKHRALPYCSGLLHSGTQPKESADLIFSYSTKSTQSGPP